MAPSFAPPTPSPYAGVLDELHNLNIATLPMFIKIAENPNGHGGGEGGGSRRGYDLKRHWQPWEDVKLRELVDLYGPKNWNIVSEKLHGRSGKSCRLRWVNQLDPKIKKAKFSKEEDDMLMAAHLVFGNQWSQIAKFFPGRTDNGIKNHWHVMTGRRKRIIAGVSTSSSGSFQLPVSGDSTNGSSGSTISLMGKSTVTSERTSLPCMNTPSSAVKEEETNTRLASIDGGSDGYLKNSMELTGGHMMPTSTFVPSKSRLFIFNPLEKPTSISKITTRDSTASNTTAASRGPPKFFNFLGIDE